MQISDFHPSDQQKFNAFSSILKKEYGIDVTSTDREVLEMYEEKLAIATGSEKTKVSLIVETMRLAVKRNTEMKINESQMDKAELALAAKSVLTSLQDMAEKVAKLEAEGILPLLDGIKEQFGPEMAGSLNDTTNEQLRSVMDALKTAKDSIGTQILNMERVVSGEEPITDMSQNAGVSDSGSDDLTAALDTPDSEDNAPSDGDIAAALGNVEGRQAKESFANKTIAMLAESKDPDAMIALLCARKMRTGMTVKEAVAAVSSDLMIDSADIISTLKDHFKK